MRAPFWTDQSLNHSHESASIREVMGRGSQLAKSGAMHLLTSGERVVRNKDISAAKVHHIMRKSLHWARAEANSCTHLLERLCHLLLQLRLPLRNPRRIVFLGHANRLVGKHLGQILHRGPCEKYVS